MIVLISPAKSLNFLEGPIKRPYSHPPFLEDSEKLIKKLRRLSRKKIREMMHISENLAQLNADRYARWEPGPVIEGAKQAIFAFRGDVYLGMDADSFSEEDLDYAQDHLRILSGLYGILKPLDLIQPYRLEMGTKLKIGRKNDLYEFWKEKLTAQIQEKLEQDEHKIVFNLASKEYFSSVDFSQLDAEVIEPSFLDWKNGKYKSISFFLKKARGLMTAWIIKHRITSAEDLKSFEADGYAYNEELSAAGNGWVFSRKQED